MTQPDAELEKALAGLSAAPAPGSGQPDAMEMAIREAIAAGTIDPAVVLPAAAENLREWARFVGRLEPVERALRVSDKLAVLSALHENAREIVDAALAGADLERRAEGNGGGEAGPLTRVYTPAELFAREPETIDWVCWPYIARGDVVSFESPPKDGKTTFVLSLVAAVASRGRFLGQQTQGGSVLYCTEERGGTFSDVLKRVGAEACEDLRIMLLHESAWRLPWPEIVAEITRHAQEMSAALVVVDTLAKWAALHGDDEQSAGCAMATMAPLQHLASKGIGVAVIRHERKSGGAVGQAGRGSSAFTGEMDTIVAVRRVAGEKTKRLVAAVGRHDETPEETIVEFDAGTFRNLGDPVDLRRLEQEREVIDNLHHGEGGAVTIKEACGTVSRRAGERILGRLIREGVVRRGQIAGERGQSPYGYWLRGDNE